jgi:diguanylate cyclase (GGDEF)-like protein
MWGGARRFERGQVEIGYIFAGAIGWLACCQFESFYASQVVQIRVFSFLIVAYTLATTLEYWYARDKELKSRWLAVMLPLVQAVFFTLRIVFADRLPFPGGTQGFSRDWVPIGMFGLLLYNFCMPFLVVNMAKERLELRHRRASLVDPLTGVANRRAFIERSERHLQRAAADGETVAILILDLDLFKRVNDTFGHQAGDRVLCAFCEVAQSALRPSDLFGRLGGEEFACLLPGATASAAYEIAERIRARFEGREVQVGTAVSSSTVSIGIATTTEAGRDLTALFAAADRALYLAKSNGRNRIEQARPAQPTVAPLVPEAPAGSDAHLVPTQAVA